MACYWPNRYSTAKARSSFTAFRQCSVDKSMPMRQAGKRVATECCPVFQATPHNAPVLCRGRRHRRFYPSANASTNSARLGESVCHYLMLASTAWCNGRGYPRMPGPFITGDGWVRECTLMDETRRCACLENAVKNPATFPSPETLRSLRGTNTAAIARRSNAVPCGTGDSFPSRATASPQPR